MSAMLLQVTSSAPRNKASRRNNQARSSPFLPTSNRSLFRSGATPNLLEFEVLFYLQPKSLWRKKGRNGKGRHLLSVGRTAVSAQLFAGGNIWMLLLCGNTTFLDDVVRSTGKMQRKSSEESSMKHFQIKGQIHEAESMFSWLSTVRILRVPKVCSYNSHLKINQNFKNLS